MQGLSRHPHPPPLTCSPRIGPKSHPKPLRDSVSIWPPFPVLVSFGMGIPLSRPSFPRRLFPPPSLGDIPCTSAALSTPLPSSTIPGPLDSQPPRRREHAPAAGKEGVPLGGRFGPALDPPLRRPDLKAARTAVLNSASLAGCTACALRTSFWRRGWDSNPRCGFPQTRFPSVLLQPLGHLSVRRCE